MMTYITGDEVDLSLNRSLEELISSYYEAHAAGIELDTRFEELVAYFTLEKLPCRYGSNLIYYKCNKLDDISIITLIV